MTFRGAPWNEHSLIACAGNCFEIKANRYARYTDACAAAREAGEIVGAARDDGSSKRINKARVVNRGKMWTGTGPDRSRAPVLPPL